MLYFPPHFGDLKVNRVNVHLVSENEPATRDRSSARCFYFAPILAV